MRKTQPKQSMNARQPAAVAGFARALPAEYGRVTTLRKVFGVSGKDFADRPGIPVVALEDHFIHA